MNLISAVHRSIFRIVSQSAQNIQQDCYVVGGYVRDFLLRRSSHLFYKDLDILTIGEGIKLAQEVSKHIKPSPRINIFKRFGTAMLEYNNQKIEFVGSRKESYHLYSRKPIINFGTLQDDQNRRDFTINALAISLNQKNYGELIDPFGGLLDLKKKILRTPLNSDRTYSDDPLRMMRAIRFATQLKFIIEESSFQSIQKNKNRINIVAIERVTEEFNKILLSKNPSIGLFLLYKSGLLSMILPELTLLKGIGEKDGYKHKDNFDHTLQVVDNISQKEKNSIWLRWAALLHDIGKSYTKKFFPKTGWSFHAHEFVGSKMVPNIFQRLKLPKGKPMKYVKKMIQHSYRPISLIGTITSDSALRRLLFDMGKDIEDLINLCIADITTKNIEKKNRYKKNLFFLMERIRKLEDRDRIKNWKSPISGNDIMNAFHIDPCKKIGIIKNFIKESILEGRISNEFHSAYFLMLKKGKELGLKKK
ncbi:MAG: CCA tRNA nucleotidyltransferase [Flavobacteriales bacterium]|jgi:putative nucleotidyltransferase with HDIG domain|uniref:CCA tRNA nucleotidyltransferase n=1 Tax=Blattabacterium sp. (Mastotermes darwiniensis) TaxID=39768 RepID=UPI000231DDC8|nr:HD domain-containing protein [Blattabacterium sp. (Mastotermes darwiniensis)]AER40508.1 tRNA nucleotidyltransferase [Blattabacterium sp. (Mastotermes darwiniensis) str. MADAR]MDR1804977.1 CCA tRNA nucleotidyltransferase [Flavobacteriales bacterium]